MVGFWLKMKMFSSVVFSGYLSDESLKDMMPMDKKRTEIFIWKYLCSNPGAEGVC